MTRHSSLIFSFYCANSCFSSIYLVYPVDFSLTYAQRLQVVREYYYATYVDPVERLEAYGKDDVAVRYLGETYQSLYTEFANLIGA